VESRPALRRTARGGPLAGPLEPGFHPVTSRAVHGPPPAASSKTSDPLYGRAFDSMSGSGVSCRAAHLLHPVVQALVIHEGPGPHAHGVSSRWHPRSGCLILSTGAGCLLREVTGRWLS
jgi:hypothetical protein